MAMTLPITISSTPSPPASESSALPRSSISPSMQTLSLSSNPSSNGQMKRKPSRRANTAERRATHNAVERQRRETLNGRFLDLAALLPNLSQIRRPSKSSIVNSSIAHIHASRRHRLLASRELRSVKLETDALRHELNEWRDRAGLPRVEEPVRAEGFSMVLSGELEVLAAVNDDEDDSGGQGYDGYDDGEDDFPGAGGNPPIEEMDESRTPMAQATNMAMLKNNTTFAPPTNPGANGGGMHLSHVIPRGPMIASGPSAVSFENPAMTSMYEPQHFPGFVPHPHSAMGQGNTGKWDAQLYSMLAPIQQQQLLQPQRSLYTPPSSSHGLPAEPAASGNSAPNPFADPASHAYFADLQRQRHFANMHQQEMGPHGGGHMYGTPEGDEVSSADSGGNRSERSSLSGSGYGSPQHGSPPGSYEIPSVLSSVPSSGPGDYVPRRMSAGGSAWGRGDVEGLGGMGMMKSSISVGGGNTASCFAMMI